MTPCRPCRQTHQEGTSCTTCSCSRPCALVDTFCSHFVPWNRKTIPKGRHRTCRANKLTRKAQAAQCSCSRPCALVGTFCSHFVPWNRKTIPKGRHRTCRPRQQTHQEGTSCKTCSCSRPCALVGTFCSHFVPWNRKTIPKGRHRTCHTPTTHLEGTSCRTRFPWWNFGPTCMRHTMHWQRLFDIFLLTIEALGGLPCSGDAQERKVSSTSAIYRLMVPTGHTMQLFSLDLAGDYRRCTGYTPFRCSRCLSLFAFRLGNCDSICSAKLAFRVDSPDSRQQSRGTASIPSSAM